jgi:hypothetical protein
MGWKAKKNPAPHATRAQTLDCTPVKNLHVREARLEGGEVLLQFPAAENPWTQRLARWFAAREVRPASGKLQLDRLGTAVWDLIDGQSSLGRIVSAFAAAHQLERREAEIAVAQFVRELGRRGLVGLR